MFIHLTEKQGDSNGDGFTLSDSVLFLSTNSNIVTETVIDENLIAIQSPGQGCSVSENPNYKLQIINTDLQSSEVIDIFINDNTPDPTLRVEPPGVRVGSTGDVQSSGFGQLISNSST